MYSESRVPLAQVPKNPTDTQRHEMTREALLKADRIEDYEYIIKNLSPPPDITTYAAPGQYKGIKVAVVGAGIGGLCTAFELRKLGFDITVFESEEERIGGRIYTHYFDYDKKLYGELGAGRVPASHETVWHYINLFDLNTTRISRGKADPFVYVRGVRARNNPKEIMEKIYPLFDLTPSEKSTPWPKLYEQVVYTALKSLRPEERAEMLQVKPIYSPEATSIGEKTLRRAISDLGLSNEAINLITSLIPTVNSFIEGVFYTELVTEYGLFTENTYRIDDGMANFPLAFYKSLTSDNPREYNLPQESLGKVVFKMGSWVGACSKSEKDGKISLLYLTRQEPQGVSEEFDYVFFAVPLTSLRKVYFEPYLSNSKNQATREVTYIDAQKTLFLCKERFWEKQGIQGGVSNTDLIIQSIMYPQDHSHCGQDTQEVNAGCSPDEPGVLGASYNMGNDAIRFGSFKTFRTEVIKRQVELVHGFPYYYLDNIVVDSKTVDWNCSEWISGAFVNNQPYQGTRYLFELAKPEFDNRVYFSGESFSPPSGWIQASLQSAIIASNALAYYLKTHGHKR